MVIRSMVLRFVLLALAASAAVAQSPAPAASKPAAVAPALKIGPVSVSGSFRSRLEAWNWFDSPANDAYAFSGNVLRLSFTGTGEKIDWMIEMAAPFLLGMPDDAVGPGAQGQLGLGASYSVANGRVRNAGMVFAKQAFLRWKAGAHALRFGRFEFADGAEVMPADPSLAWVKRERITQRLIGPFGWSHVGRSFDGMHWAWTRGRTNFTFMGGLATRGAFQVDGWGNLHVGTGYAALTRQLGGKNHSADLRVFGIYYQDWRNVLKTDSRPVALRQTDRANIRVGSFGGHLIHQSKTTAGTVDTLIWVVGQTGRWGRLDHRASAWAAEAGFQPGVLPRLKPWLRVGYFRGSGDDNPLDGEHGTFFQILPTPRPYARTPFFDLVNNEDFTGMILLRPHRAVTLRGEVHGLRLTNANDMWYAGGGAFQPWSFGYLGRPSNGRRGLATMYDVSADYNVNAHVALTGYFGYARGHSVVRSIFPEGQTLNFGYAEITYRF